MKTIRFDVSDEQHEALIKLAVKNYCQRRNGTGDIAAMNILMAGGYLSVSRPKSSQKAETGSKAERKKFRFYANSPPKFWDKKYGCMDLDEVMRRTGTTRADLEEVGFRCTDKIARAPIGWTAWSEVKVPDWWVDSDNMPGMLVKDCPVEVDDLKSLGLMVVEEEVMLPQY